MQTPTRMIEGTVTNDRLVQMDRVLEAFRDGQAVTLSCRTGREAAEAYRIVLSYLRGDDSFGIAAAMPAERQATITAYGRHASLRVTAPKVVSR